MKMEEMRGCCSDFNAWMIKINNKKKDILIQES